MFITKNYYNSILKIENNNIKNNEIALLDPESTEFKKSLKMAYKERLGNNYKEIIEKNNNAVKIANELNLNYQNKITKQIEYPSDFGGMYINDNQQLVIQIVKKSKIKNTIKSVSSKLNNDNNIIYEYVENSNEKLDKVNKQIQEYFTNNITANKGFKANYIDVVNNVVVVELDNNTSEEQNWFKENVINSDVIKFIKNENNMTEIKNYYVGDKYSASQGQCSVGYRAKKNGVEGFVTAAHCVNNNEKILGLGEVNSWVYSGTKGVDATFIQTYSGNSVSNYLAWPTDKTTSISTEVSDAPIFGMMVVKSGYRTQTTVGFITNVDYSSYTEDGIYWQRLVNTTCTSNHGDSGGIVFISSSSGYAGKTTGIVHACEQQKNATDCNEFSMSYSRADLINKALGVSRY